MSELPAHRLQQRREELCRQRGHQAIAFPTPTVGQDPEWLHCPWCGRRWPVGPGEGGAT